jgi:hypothetical protein
MIFCLVVLTVLAVAWTWAWLMPEDQGLSRIERLIRSREGRPHD